ncbi:MAG: hypothetical protein MR902_06945 [Campylobacter sp.]|nr:hypothetical protein [Campylobacter sp.]
MAIDIQKVQDYLDTMIKIGKILCKTIEKIEQIQDENQKLINNNLIKKQWTI